ncbi:hypothetical protein D5086_019460 [Populus alba]|uniref:Uncharacterized protein n=1 Tax=Populus alba TaxID=43335 RepID=A0ACC4BIW4_POPAL
MNWQATQAAQGSSIVGSFVWVEDPEEAWMDGEVVEVNGEDITVNCAPGKMKPGGIIAHHDEACMFPRLTHETFAEKLYQTFKDHKRFSKPKLARIDFTICHYAGDVTYQTEPFLDKNKDYVVAEHQALLSESKCSFVSGLFPPLPEESAKSSKFSSIGSRYKGVMEAIRISCAGYPTRKTFDDFARCFAILAPDVLHGSCDEVSACKRLLEKANLEGYQEVPVIDNELVNKLTAENEMLKAMVSSMEKKIVETEKKYEETNKLSEVRLKQALDAESKIIELKTTMQRLEEKLSDLEAEDQVLQHQALFSSSSRKMSEHLEITSLNQDDSNHMAYWLSNTSMLLFLLQRTLKGSGANPNLPPPPTSFFGRMAKVPPILAQKLFIQIFSYINVQLFNSFLLRRECCTFSNGEYVKAELAELELWCGHAKEEVLF